MLGKNPVFIEKESFASLGQNFRAVSFIPLLPVPCFKTVLRSRRSGRLIVISESCCERMARNGAILLFLPMQNVCPGILSGAVSRSI